MAEYKIKKISIKRPCCWQPLCFKIALLFTLITARQKINKVDELMNNRPGANAQLFFREYVIRVPKKVLLSFFKILLKII